MEGRKSMTQIEKKDDQERIRGIRIRIKRRKTKRKNERLKKKRKKKEETVNNYWMNVLLGLDLCCVVD